MNIYVIGMGLTLVLMGALKVWQGTEKRKKQCMFWFAFLFWGGVMAVRGVSVGTDTWNYQALFQEASFVSFRELPGYYLFQRCPAYTLYSKMISVFCSHPQAIVFMNSVVYMAGILSVLYKNSDNFGMSVYLLLAFHNYFYAMNATRMSMAAMFVMWAYHFGIRGKKKGSALCFVLAVFTHSIALVGAVPVFLSWIKVNWLRAAAMAAVCCVAIPSLRIAASLFIKIFPAYADYLNAGNGWNNIYYEGGGGGRRALIAFFLMAIFLLCLIWKQAHRVVLKDEGIFWRLLVICSIALISMVVWRKVYIFARLEYFFTYFFMLFVPFCIERFFKQKHRIAAYAGIIAVLFVPFYVKLADYLPYCTFLG